MAGGLSSRVTQKPPRFTILSRIACERLQGNIVNVSSFTGQKPFPNCLAYCISKAALDQFTKVVALELAPKQVRVNLVNPAVIDFQNREVMSPTQYAVFMRHFEKTNALERIRQPRLISKAIAFLAKNSASFITGTILAVDGKWERFR